MNENAGEKEISILYKQIDIISRESDDRLSRSDNQYVEEFEKKKKKVSKEKETKVRKHS